MIMEVMRAKERRILIFNVLHSQTGLCGKGTFPWVLICSCDNLINGTCKN